jgi:hypothetical protein
MSVEAENELIKTFGVSIQRSESIGFASRRPEQVKR